VILAANDGPTDPSLGGVVVEGNAGIAEEAREPNWPAFPVSLDAQKGPLSGRAACARRPSTAAYSQHLAPSIGERRVPQVLGWVDAHGDVYIGEVSWTAWQNYTNPGQPVPANLRSLQKLARVAQ